MKKLEVARNAKFLQVFILIFLSISFSCVDYSSTSEIEFVYDHEMIMDSAQENQLERLFIQHEKATGNEIVLVTTHSYAPDSNIFSYSLNKFRQMGIGKKDIDNGVLIVYSGANREVRIATGYGTETVLTNDTASKIINEIMIPHFKKDQAFKGLLEGSLTIVKFLEKPGNEIKPRAR